MTIFDLVSAQEIASYWLELMTDVPPYFGETLFPDDQKLGLDLKWIKGSTGTVQVLKPSAFDVSAIPRPRIGFSTLQYEMPFFKESKYIDETLRQELHKVLENGSPAIIDAIMRRVFADEVELIRAARAQRERMRMALLTTGTIDIEANGQLLSYDYGVPAANKVSVATPWSDPDSDLVNEIREWQDQIDDERGVRPTRAVTTRAVWQAMMRNRNIIRSVFVLSNGEANMNDVRMRNYLMEELGISVHINMDRFVDERGASNRFIPDNTFVLFPEGNLGTTWFGTTPEQSDLMSSNVANVAMVDTGVAVTTMEKVDPVQVETKVTMICLPSFEASDEIIIADVG